MKNKYILISTIFAIIVCINLNNAFANHHLQPKPKATQPKSNPKKSKKKKMTSDTITTASGLQIKIHKKSNSGIKAKKGEKIDVHYTGTLLNGKKFDSSKDRNQPFTFNVGTGQVIAGWDEAFLILEEGDSATIILPSSIGYGSQDMGNIPPNSTLIFDVELLKVYESRKPYNSEGKQTITTKSGLSYVIIDKGDETKPAKNSNTAVMHYAGYLLDGTQFDSSFDRDQPFELPVQNAGVIEGWKEMLLLMNKGMKVKVTLPPSLAYGARGAGGVIPPNATLIFDMYLVDLK
jgi:peptidylprolyl isomerase